MPISDFNTATTSGATSPGMGGFNFGGFNMGNLPGYQQQGGMSSQQMGALPADFSSIQKLLSTQPQSMTNSLMPGLMQILGLQTGQAQGMFGNQTSQLVSGQQSDAMARGMTGSSIEAAGMLGARQAGQANMNQFLGQQLGQLGNAYQGSIGADVNAQNQQYQNMAQAIGQQMQSQQAFQMFMDQQQQQRNLAGDANRNSLWGSAISGLGGAGSALLMKGILSDEILKKNIKKVDEIEGLGLYEFEYRRDEFPNLNLSSGKKFGFMAQEVIKKFPEFVKEIHGFLTVDYIGLASALEA